MLQDQHGRIIRKLRLSLTDKCNLRCNYCMPVDQQFMSEDNYLTPLEYEKVVGELVELGVEEVRLTGGEPLMRKSFPEIIQRLSQLKLKKLSLTTNGILLDKYFEDLKDTGIFHLNVSLDSLNPVNFKQITYGNHCQKVKENVIKAAALGFVVKINMVVMKGVNDHEILDFVNFSSQHGIEVRFLELMRIGHACGPQDHQFISAKEMLRVIEAQHLLKAITMPSDSTSFNFLTDSGAQLGFIASESQAFCGACSRWRLSADGILRACLLKEDGVALKGLKTEERFKAYQQLLGMKPLMRPLEVAHSMNAIGG
jgi:GTP 3',8-cyclase